MRTLVWVLLVALLVAAVCLVVALFGLRLGREVADRRRETRHGEVRDVILTALMGEPDEAARARADLRTRSGRGWDEVEDQAFAMVPKIKGDSHDALVTLLLSKGAAAHASTLARSRSQVRRARGAHRLGALAQSDAVSLLLGLLHDHAFLVRRTAVRALGQVGDPIAVPPMLDAVTADPRLSRDVLAAIGRTGSAAAPMLRRELLRTLSEPVDNRRAALTAVGLGVLGDVSAAPLLTVSLEDRDQPGLAVASAEALGSLGAPESVEPLLRAMADADPDLRVAAARALGSVGDVRVAPRLAGSLRDRHHLTSRAVAGALLRLGDPGLLALRASPSPYAAEALAVHRVRHGG
ncbi:MAG: HEAT repeat domain-containing protein [Nocardioidaceae bacterium]